MKKTIHGMDKPTKWVLKQMSNCHTKKRMREKVEEKYNTEILRILRLAVSFGTDFVKIIC